MFSMIIALSVLIAFLVIALLGLVGYSTYQTQHKVHRKVPRKQPRKKVPSNGPDQTFWE